MKFDFKITTWERVTVAPEDEEKVLQAIKDGHITSANGIYEEGLGVHLEDANCDTIDGLEEQMTPEENGGSSTIEVLDDEGDAIWINGEG